MRHRSNIFGLFGGSKAPKAAKAPPVDPTPFYERAAALSRQHPAKHFLVKAPAQNGRGEAWFWLTSASTGAFGVQALERARGGSYPKRYWKSASPWATVKNNLSGYRSPEREKFVYIDVYTGEAEGPLTLADIQTRKNTSKIITPTAVVDSVMMDLLAEPPGKRDGLIAWLRKPENMDWAKGYARSVIDGRKTPTKPTPAPKKDFVPVILGGGAIGRIPPAWMDEDDFTTLNHNTALIQAFSQAFKHAWPKWAAFRKATLEYVKEEGVKGVEKLSTLAHKPNEEAVRLLKRHFSGTGLFRSAFSAPRGVNQHHNLRQKSRFIPAYVSVDGENRGEYDRQVLLMETDGNYALGPIHQLSRETLGYGAVEFDNVVPTDFLSSVPSKYMEKYGQIKLKHLLVTWPHNREKLDTPEKITDFFQKADKAKQEMDLTWIFEKPHTKVEGGINPFLLSYVSYRMGSMILIQRDSSALNPILGYPIDQTFVQDNRPSKLSERGDQVAVIMPMRLDF